MMIRAITILTIIFAFSGSLAMGQGKGKGANHNNPSKHEAGLRKNEFGKGGHKHDRAKKRISGIIMADSKRKHGKSMSVDDYAEQLANVLGQLDQEALARVLGDKLSSIE